MRTLVRDRVAEAQLKVFIQLKLNEKMEFICPQHQGAKIVDRMRVRLSRLRTAARAQKRVIKQFKLVTEAIIPHAIDGVLYDKVILVMSKNSITEIQAAMGVLSQVNQISDGAQVGTEKPDKKIEKEESAKLRTQSAPVQATVRLPIRLGVKR
jgi:hypothetical protein